MASCPKCGRTKIPKQRDKTRSCPRCGPLGSNSQLATFVAAATASFVTPSRTTSSNASWRSMTATILASIITFARRMLYGAS